MATKKTDKEETKPEETALVAQEAPGALVAVDYGDDLGGGFEDQDASYIQLPWINLLQQMTPLVSKCKDGSFKAGQFLETMSGKAMDGPVLIVPSTIKREIVRWVPRDKGGGFLGTIDPRDPEWEQAVKDAKKFGKNSDRDGNDLVETFYLYGVLCDGNRAVLPFAMSCASTKIKPVRNINTRMQMIQVNGKPIPMFGNLLTVSSLDAENKVGQPYKNLVFEFAVKDAKGEPNGWASMLPTDDQRFLQAKSLNQTIRGGKFKVDRDAEAQIRPDAKNDESAAPF